jgi:hypothetical protein
LGKRRLAPDRVRKDGARPLRERRSWRVRPEITQKVGKSEVASEKPAQRLGGDGLQGKTLEDAREEIVELW